MTSMRTVFILLLFFLAVMHPGPARAHDAAATSADVTLDEHLGAQIPAGIFLRDESGGGVELKALLDKPAIIAPVYFGCTRTCPLLLTGLADVLGKLQFVEPGKDFRVITVSFDDRDTPAIAREKKPNYLASLNESFPADEWPFLTGDAVNIKKFTEAVGFRVQRTGKDFTHPIALVVVAPGGRIVRYLYGVTFLPFSVTMAITEAAQGKLGSTAGRVLTYCFSYDPEKNSYGFNILKVVGTVVALTILSFFAYLTISGKKKKQ